MRAYPANKKRKSARYIPFINAFKQKGTEFHTFQRRNETNFKVILRNLRPSMEPEEIIAELDHYDHKIVCINCTRHAHAKAPLQLFMVEQEARENNKKIYKIKTSLNMAVKFEPPQNTPQEVRSPSMHPFCSAKSYPSVITRPDPSVGSTGQHLTSEYPTTSRDETAKCCKCGGQHTANYRRCIIY